MGQSRIIKFLLWTNPALRGIWARRRRSENESLELKVGCEEGGEEKVGETTSRREDQADLLVAAQGGAGEGERSGLANCHRLA